MDFLRTIRFGNVKEVNEHLTRKLANDIREVEAVKVVDNKVMITTKRKDGFSPQFKKHVSLEEGKDISELESLDEETNNAGYLMSTTEAKFFLERALNFLGEFSLNSNGEVIYMEIEGSPTTLEDEMRELVEMAIFVDSLEYLSVIADKLGMKSIAEEARNM